MTPDNSKKCAAHPLSHALYRRRATGLGGYALSEGVAAPAPAPGPASPALVSADDARRRLRTRSATQTAITITAAIAAYREYLVTAL